MIYKITSHRLASKLFGVHKDYWELTGSEHIDEGRYKVTKNEEDKYM